MSYFVSKFKTIQTPKPGVTNYEERLSSSVVGMFNCSQRSWKEGMLQWHIAQLDESTQAKSSHNYALINRIIVINVQK